MRWQLVLRQAVIFTLIWLPSSLDADDILCVLHDVVFQLERVSGATTRAPHRYLATTLGLD